MQLNTGDNVQWTSAAGVKQGVIKKKSKKRFNNNK
mgnify:CR=1 FL=1